MRLVDQLSYRITVGQRAIWRPAVNRNSVAQKDGGSRRGKLGNGRVQTVLSGARVLGRINLHGRRGFNTEDGAVAKDR